MSDNSGLVLTPAAKRALDTYIDSERHEIVVRATQVAREGGDKTIDAQAIIAALPSRAAYYSARLEMDESNSERYGARRRSLLAVLALYGIVLTVGGILFAIYFQFRESLTYSTVLSLAVAASGAIIGATTAFYYSISRQGNSRRLAGHDYGLSDTNEMRYLISDFIDSWNRLEIAAQLVADKLQVHRRGLRDIILELADTGRITEHDAESFLASLRMRNTLVHPSEISVTSYELERQILEVERLRDVLLELI